MYNRTHLHGLKVTATRTKSHNKKSSKYKGLTAFEALFILGTNK